MTDSEAPVTRAWRARVERGALTHDPAQARLAAALDRVLEQSQGERLSSKSSALGWLFGAKKPDTPAPRGLYIHGGVGRGKSMLMDLFFSLAPHRRKRRVHFHAFMGDVHGRIHEYRQSDHSEGDDPIPPVAEDIAETARLLCFDEFAVTDVADAMILSRLFTELFRHGVTVVATSNVAPRDLYRDGLNRGSFMKFVDLVEERMEVFALDTDTDYRRAKLAGQPVWFATGDPGFDALWNRLRDGTDEEPTTIAVKGRRIEIARTANGMARVSFAELVRQGAGRAGLPCRFRPLPHPVPRSRAEAGTRQPQRGQALHRARGRALRGPPPPGRGGRRRARRALRRATHGTEAFEFARTVSRLVEMRGEDWPPTDCDDWGGMRLPRHDHPDRALLPPQAAAVRVIPTIESPPLLPPRPARACRKT